MADKYFIGIYWGNRKDDLLDCVDKVKATLDFLRSVDESFAAWYKTSRPRKGETLVPIDTSWEGVKSLLLKGRNYNDIGELLKDLGYLVHLKSEKDYSKAHVFSITCGSYFEKVSNNVGLSIGKNDAYEYLHHEDVLEKIFNRFVDIWKPENGIVRCNDNELIAMTF